MSKTNDTINIEKDLHFANIKQGLFTCFEVTIGWFGKERVDFLTYDTKGIWKCYEIKTSLADFKSKCKNTFIGHYNYYAMTKDLYSKVKDDVPKGIGVYVNGQSVKRAIRYTLKIDEKILLNSMIRSLTRDKNKHYQSLYTDKNLGYYTQLLKCRKERDKYKRWYNSEIDDRWKVESELRDALRELKRLKSD
jgi:hypothetical protein